MVLCTIKDVNRVELMVNVHIHTHMHAQMHKNTRKFLEMIYIFSTLVVVMVSKSSKCIL